MDDVINAMEDNQYMDAMIDDTPHPTKKFIYPSSEELNNYQIKMKELNSNFFELDIICRESIGLYMFSKFCKSEFGKTSGLDCLCSFILDVSEFRETTSINIISIINEISSNYLMNDSMGCKDESISRSPSLRRILPRPIQDDFADESKVGDVAIESSCMQYFKPSESKNAIKVIGLPLTKVLERIKRLDETISIDLLQGLLSLFNELDDIIFNYIKINYFEAFKASEYWLKYLQFMYITNTKVTKNDFTLCRVLGRGGFGLVTACKHSTTGKLYALKTMDKARVKMKKGEALCRNEREIQALIDSKFVVCLKYAYTTDIDVNLIMDVMTGGDLSYHLGRKRKFSMKETIYYSSRIVQGLSDMHEKNIVYRDLKPENVLMDEFGYTRLSDLGLACIVPKKGLVGLAGTRGYWAPEMLMRDENNKRIKYGLACDWFSLGCCIYEFICGISPFRIKKAKSFKSVDEATLEMIPEFDDHFDSLSIDLLSKLLEKDQTKRLGANGALEIKMHPFFSQVDWGLVHQKTPPLKPLAEINTGGQDDIGAFQDITDQNIIITEDDHKSYDGWDFLSVKTYQEEIINLLLHEEKSGSIVIQNDDIGEGGCCIIS